MSIVKVLPYNKRNEHFVKLWYILPATDAGNCFNAGHFRNTNSCNRRKCPAELGNEENLALLARYNSCNATHAPISSGKVFRLFPDSEIRSICCSKPTSAGT